MMANHPCVCYSILLLLQEESINWGSRHDDDLSNKDRDLEQLKQVRCVRGGCELCLCTACVHSDVRSGCEL